MITKQFTILFVEDEVDIREEMEFYLEHIFKECYFAKDGLEGLKLFKEKKPDIIISDISMPNMDGLEMVQHIRGISPHTPIILLTGNTDTDFFKKAIELSVDKYINKPVNLKLLSTSLKQLAENLNIKLEMQQQTTLLEQYKNTVDMSSIVSKTDIYGTITYVNDNFIEISGYKEEELLGKNHNIVRHPDMKKDVYEDLWYTIKNLKKTWKGVVKNKRKDNTVYWVNVTISPVLDINGNIVEFIALRVDVTREEEYKHSLEDDLNTVSNEVHYNRQYEHGISTMVPIIKTDIQNNITYINEAFSTLSGYTLTDLKGVNCTALRAKKHRDLEDCTNMQEIIRTNKTVRKIFTNIDVHGNEYIVDNFFYPVVNKKSEVCEVMQVMHDLTEIHKLNEDIIKTQKEVVYTMGAIGETRSKETGLHVKRVAEYSYLLAKLSGLSEENASLLKQASPMHDIGKVGIADNILNKPGKLTKEEFEIMKTHAELGYEMLKYSNQPILQASASIAYSHHEKWDGSGYPLSLSAENIPIFGRITAIADVFDALGHDRCYKKAWQLEEILDLFKKERGVHFDPNLIDLFFEHLDDFLKIQAEMQDIL